jgi:hypothetical protein
MALTSQELATNSRCFACIPTGIQDAVLIYLLAQIANVTDPQTLVTNARCYDCIPQGLKPAVIMYLQDAILAGGGGGGGGCEVFKLLGGAIPGSGETPAGGCGGVAYNENDEVWVFRDDVGWAKIIG